MLERTIIVEPEVTKGCSLLTIIYSPPVVLVERPACRFRDVNFPIVVIVE